MFLRIAECTYIVGAGELASPNTDNSFQYLFEVEVKGERRRLLPTNDVHSNTGERFAFIFYISRQRVEEQGAYMGSKGCRCCLVGVGIGMVVGVGVRVMALRSAK